MRDARVLTLLLLAACGRVSEGEVPTPCTVECLGGQTCDTKIGKCGPTCNATTCSHPYYCASDGNCRATDDLDDCPRSAQRDADKPFLPGEAGSPIIWNWKVLGLTTHTCVSGPAPGTNPCGEGVESVEATFEYYDHQGDFEGTVVKYVRGATEADANTNCEPKVDGDGHSGLVRVVICHGAGLPDPAVYVRDVDAEAGKYSNTLCGTWQ
jgi:hypothetical protein